MDHASGREVLVLIGIILLPTTLLPLLDGVSPIPVRPIPIMLEGLTGYSPAGLAAGEPAAPAPPLRPLDLSGRRLGLVLGRVGQLGLRSLRQGFPSLRQRLPPEPLPARRRPVRLDPGPL